MRLTCAIAMAKIAHNIITEDAIIECSELVNAKVDKKYCFYMF